jgi:hypothetical protein
MDIEEAINTALSLTAEELTEVLQNSAHDKGWSDKLAKSVNIGYSGNVMQLNVPSDIEGEVFDEEYGTENAPPKTVLRNIHNHPRARGILDKHVKTHVVSAFNELAKELL